MSMLVFLRKGLVLFFIFFITALLSSCSSSTAKKATVASTSSKSEQKRLAALETYARRGDVVATIALDKSIVHITRGFTGAFSDTRDYWFDPKTKSIVIQERGHRGDKSAYLFTREKDSLTLKQYAWGGFRPYMLYDTEINDSALEQAKNQYSPETFMDLFGEAAEAFRKLPSYAYATSNSEFLSYFYDPTYIGGSASDYSYGPKQTVTLAGREAYKIRIGPSNSYKKKLRDGLKEDYIGRSYIDAYLDKKTGLPLKIDRFIDNDRLKYSMTASIDPVKISALPAMSAPDNREPTNKYYRRLLLPGELQKYNFQTLGNSYRGFTGQPITLESTDTTNWTASLLYKKGADGFIIEEVDTPRSGAVKEQFLNRMNGVCEEKTFTERSHKGLTGAAIHEGPIPKVQSENLKVSGSDAILYSYVGLFALELHVGDKAIFVHALNEYRGDFSLSRDMLLEIASALIKNE
ncbi:MAG: hypothetical protein ACYC56_05620 [Candidatus Aquicultor sp.]